MAIKADGRCLCSGCHTSLRRLSIVQWVSHFPSQATDCAVAVSLPYRDYLLCSGWRTSLPSRPDRAPEVIARSHRRGVLLRTTHHLIYMSPTIIVPSKQFKVNFLYLIYLMGKWGECWKNNKLIKLGYKRKKLAKKFCENISANQELDPIIITDPQ